MSCPDEKQMIAEFFDIFPDYELCRTSAQNVIAGVTTYQRAREIMWRKAEGERLNRDAINEKLEGKKIHDGRQLRVLRDMSWRDISRLPDPSFEEVVKFYLKHPYAHSRTGRRRIVPRLLRTLFLRQLVGQAINRRLDVDFNAAMEMIGMV